MIRGEVYWADVNPRSGSEQSGKRPVVIISHDIFNRRATWMSIIVIPFSTSARQAARGPTTVMVSAGIAGLRQDSVVLCHQVTTLDRRKLGSCMGILPAGKLAEVETGLKVAMSLR